MEMIQQLSRRVVPASERRSPIAGRRPPLADVLESDSALETMLHDLDIALIFAFLGYPREVIETPTEQLLPDVDEAAMTRLRAGRAHLVIDHSAEGLPHRPQFSERLHEWCSLQGVSPSALMYITANEAYPGFYTQWCDAQGHMERYAPLCFNAFVDDIATAAAGLDWSSSEPALLHDDARPYRFLSFNGAPRPERIVVASHLLFPEPTDALVSVGFADKGRVTLERTMREINSKYATGTLLARHPALFEDLDVDALPARATLESPQRDGEVPLYKRFDLEHYERSCVSVVTETDMSGGRMRRITEKAVKPFLFGHAAIVAGNPGTLAMMRDLGFGTFEPLIDESYDEILDPNERLCAVLCEVDRLRSLTDDEFHGMFRELAVVRAANLRYGRTGLTHRVRADAIGAVTRHVLDRTRVTWSPRTTR